MDGVINFLFFGRTWGDGYFNCRYSYGGIVYAFSLTSHLSDSSQFENLDYETAFSYLARHLLYSSLIL